jgi:hypothetical protein
VQDREWAEVFVDAAEGLLIAPEPTRGRWLEFLKQWTDGIVRVQGRRLQPRLTARPVPEGLLVEYPFPERVEMVSLYVRFAGEAGWEFRCSTAADRYVLYVRTHPEMDEAEAAEKRAWYGRTVELVAVAQREGRCFGFPSELVSAEVPKDLEPAAPRAPAPEG